MKRVFVVAAVLLLIAACSDDSSSGDGAAIPAGAHEVDGGCGATVLYTGAARTGPRQRAGRPTWSRRPRTEGNAVAFLFGNPLRAGEPENPANKILWVVKKPRGVSDLDITGHPLDADATHDLPERGRRLEPRRDLPLDRERAVAGMLAVHAEWNGNTDSIDRCRTPRFLDCAP